MHFPSTLINDSHDPGVRDGAADRERFFVELPQALGILLQSTHLNFDRVNLK